MLFYSHTGGFETNDLVITCEDIFPMDLGTGGWTEFKMTEDVTAYIAENIELFSCDLGLIHSHHSMGAFFSGQDFRTLQNEGNDTNCFVSLIVDTKGTYQAAVTRKVETQERIKKEVLKKSYQFFGEGIKDIEKEQGIEQTNSNTCIEYFMLDVHREVVDNPFDYLDSRFNEIVNNKNRKAEIKKTDNHTFSYKADDRTLKDWAVANKAENFYDWLHSEDKTVGNKTAENIKTSEEIESFDEWGPDIDIIHHLSIQLLTASLIINSNIDIKQWVERHMVRKYKDMFRGDNEFSHWAEIIVEFIINHYPNENVPDAVLADYDFYIGRVAEAIYDELDSYPENKYIKEYKEELTNYLI